MLIRSISRQIPRFDDVLRTNRVWQEWGDALEVAESEAPHYLRHPKEWESITPEAYERWKAHKAKQAEIKTEVAGKWADLGLPELKQMRVDLDVEILRREQAQAMTAPVNAEAKYFTDSNPVTLKASTETAGAISDRIKAIQLAIGEMDRGDPEQWSKKTGRPYVAAVGDIVGFKVSDDEIAAALQVQKAA